MKFFMEAKKDTDYRVKISIPKKIINDTIFTEFIKISKKIKLNGFRNGKVPINIIENRYKNQIYYDVLHQLMQKFFYEFTMKNNVNILGIPKYFIHKKTSDQNPEYFEYSVEYTTYPNIKIKHTKLIQVQDISVEITKKDIEKKLKESSFNSHNAIWKEVDQSIKKYNRITINYSIFEKTKKIKEFDRKNFIFTVLQNTLLPELDKKIIHHRVNDIFFFNTMFPSFYPEKKLRNKNITFKIQIKKIEKKEIQKYNNILEKKPSLYLQFAKNQLENYIKKINQKFIEDQIIYNIAQNNFIKIPQVLLESEIKKIYKQNKQEYQKQNCNILEKNYHYNIKKQAQNKLYKKIIINQVISEQKIFLNKENIKNIINEISLNYKNPQEILKLYKKNRNVRKIIEQIDLETQAMQFLKNNVYIIKKKWNLDKFIEYDSWYDHTHYM